MTINSILKNNSEKKLSKVKMTMKLTVTLTCKSSLKYICIYNDNPEKVTHKAQRNRERKLPQKSEIIECHL